MRLIPSPELVRQALAAHSWLGLLVGALMYLVCLSGTLAVFHEEFERWEQPHVPEAARYEPAALELAVDEVLDNGTALTEHLYLTLPTPAIPRAAVSTDNEGWFVNADGSLGERASHEWTHLLQHLHLYLHLPESWGMVLVSALGALLAGLIVSGFIAHPRILRDAFSLRLGGGRLEQVDIHNRLSVWGAPFHLVIAITGAWFGLVTLTLGVVAFSRGEDPQAMIEAVYGAEPSLQQDTRHAAVAAALQQLPTLSPQGRPLYMTMHAAGTPQQFMEFAVLQPGRLIYAENFRFDTRGRFLEKLGFSDGETGRQMVYSVYRLHFGHFGGFAVKVLYALLGLALTVVSVTGINIWLERRKRRDWINHAWPGFVWGCGAGLAASAIAQVVLGVAGTPILWLGLAFAIAVGFRLQDTRRTRCVLQLATAALLVLLVLGHVLRFGADQAFGAAGIGINLALLATAGLLGWLGLRSHPQPGT